MKTLMAMTLMMASLATSASELVNCSYKLQSGQEKITLEGDELFEKLIVDTSWSNRMGCPRSLGISYNEGELNITEFHNLSRTQSNQMIGCKKCIYKTAESDHHFSDVVCLMVL